VSAVWATVVGAGVATVLLKAAGPLLLGGRSLPPRLAPVIELLAPAVLAALVVTQTVGEDEDVVLDARLVGLAAGALALRFRAPLLAVVVVAAAAAAAVRAL
jgi:branched-subunit amino acid transport protein